MKRIKKNALLVLTLLSVSFFSACDLYTYVTPSTQISYDNPTWAPPYSPGVRYYYLPDIETFYDLSTGEFVYLNDGQWSYSQSLPSIYADFDLNNCFAISLDNNIYQPWMHHQYYVSHYPRYYYRDYYDHSNIPYVRGFNENSKSAIYWSENERNRARRWDNENVNNNHQFKYSESDRRQQINFNYNNSTSRQPDNSIINRRQQPNRGDNNATNQQPNNANNNRQQPNRGDNNATNQQPNNDNNNRQQPNRSDNNVSQPNNSGNTNRSQGNEKNSIVTTPRISGFETGSRQQNAVSPVRQNQRTNYYGKTIGRPVKVEKQMRQQIQPKATNNNETRNGSDSRNQNENNRK